MPNLKIEKFDAWYINKKHFNEKPPSKEMLQQLGEGIEKCLYPKNPKIKEGYILKNNQWYSFECN